MLKYFFKINVNISQLLCFVVVAAVDGEYWRFFLGKRRTQHLKNRQYSPFAAAGTAGRSG